MKHLTLALVLTLFVGSLFGQTDEARKKNYNIKKNLAIEGYDPVSYFEAPKNMNLPTVVGAPMPWAKRARR
jgi:hypothetical protein